MWRYQWATRRCVIHVSSDNIAALSTVCKMQPSSPSLGVIARELSLDIADAIYDPQLVSHVPGVANLAADALSRLFQPGKRFSLPTILRHCKRVHPPDRTPQWWRSVVPRLRQQGSVEVPKDTVNALPDDAFQ